jgi:HD-like signal output (HDOD) protein
MSPEQKISIDVAKIKNLPPLPEASIKIIRAVNNPDISVNELVKTLSLSPVLVARLIGLSNSAYFGRAGTISDLRVAIIQVLGSNLVKSLALSVVLNMEMDASKCKLFNADLFWNHALLTAVIAQKLCVHIDDELMVSSTVYTAGLLLDIGLLAAVFVYPEQINKVLQNSDNTEGSVSNQMRLIVGLTHYQIGVLLLETWKLPLIYRHVVQEFRNTHFLGKEKKLVLLLEVCHRMATDIINNQQYEMAGFDNLLRQLSLSHDMVHKIMIDVAENKEKVSELANIISS